MFDIEHKENELTDDFAMLAGTCMVAYLVFLLSVDLVGVKMCRKCSYE